MSQITIVPIDQVVVLSGAAAFGVDMASVDPEIHAIQFNTEFGKGTVEFKRNPETGTTKPQEQITNVDPWEPQILDAEDIIFCAKNPKTFYSTVAPLGAPIEVTEKGWPQPENTTEQALPEQPSPNTSLYWDGTGFVWSVFPIDLDLVGAQNYITGLVNDRAYALLQPSDWYVVRQSETGKAIPEEWNTWRATVRDAAKAKRTVVSEKEDLTSLEAYCESPEFQTWPIEPN
jgi:hypothetical protein